MYPATHAATTPDRPAVIMGESGEVVTYRELDEIAYIVNDSGATVVVASAGVADFDVKLQRTDTGKLYKRRLSDRYWGRTQAAR